MKKITSEEFIIALLLSKLTKPSITISAPTLYRFDSLSRKNNIYCGFNFYDLGQFTLLYPSIFEYSRNTLTIKSSNEKLITALKTIYGINEDLHEIIEVLKEI